ncbi:hypothetical protein U0070_013777 [Myodes glareolus]|uniref:Uncharacterized protein n=1 Tax=Myodes glareolus TaxID=447135 RepID=A0AAW0J9C2_MYOGA
MCLPIGICRRPYRNSSVKFRGEKKNRFHFIVIRHHI